jgi:hypothetical protein
MAQKKQQNEKPKPIIQRDVDFSVEYVREVIDSVNLNPNPKNIKKMQQVLNTFLGNTMFGTPIREDSTLGDETKKAVKAFRSYESKIEQMKKREELEKAQQQYERYRTKFAPPPPAIPTLMDKFMEFFSEDTLDLNKEMKDKK